MPPVNDNIANATTVTFPVDLAGNNVGATVETGEWTAGSQRNATVWYRFVLTERKQVTFSTAGSEIDTSIVIYPEGQEDSSNNITAGYDDVGATNDVQGPNATVQVVLDPGTYMLQIGGGTNGNTVSEGDYALQGWLDDPPPDPEPPSPNPSGVNATLTRVDNGRYEDEEDRWLIFTSQNSNHVLERMARRHGLTHAILDWRLYEARPDGQLATLAETTMDYVDHPYAFADSADWPPSSDESSPQIDGWQYMTVDGDTNETSHMVLVEETATDLYFVLWTNSILGEDSTTLDASRDRFNRLFTEGWLYPYLALIPVRFNKATGKLCSMQSTNEVFTRWDDWVFIPEAGGDNIVGARLWLIPGVERTSPVSGGGHIAELGGGVYAVGWTQGGHWDPLNGEDWRSQGYEFQTAGGYDSGWRLPVMTRWTWNSSTKQIDVIDEQTLVDNDLNDERGTYGGSFHVKQDGDVIFFTSRWIGGSDWNHGREQGVAIFDPDDPVNTRAFHAHDPLDNLGEGGWWIGDRLWRSTAFYMDGNVLRGFDAFSHYQHPAYGFVYKYQFSDDRSRPVFTRKRVDETPFSEFAFASQRRNRSYYHDLTMAGYDPDGSFRFWFWFDNFVDDEYVGGVNWVCSLKVDPETGQVKESVNLALPAELPFTITTALDPFASEGSPAGHPREFTVSDIGWPYSEGYSVPSADGSARNFGLMLTFDDWNATYEPDPIDRPHYAYSFLPQPLPVIGPGGRRSRFVFA